MATKYTLETINKNKFILHIHKPNNKQKVLVKPLSYKKLPKIKINKNITKFDIYCEPLHSDSGTDSEYSDTLSDSLSITSYEEHSFF